MHRGPNMPNVQTIITLPIKLVFSKNLRIWKNVWTSCQLWKVNEGWWRLKHRVQNQTNSLLRKFQPTPCDRVESEGKYKAQCWKGGWKVVEKWKQWEMIENLFNYWFATDNERNCVICCVWENKLIIKYFFNYLFTNKKKHSDGPFW